VVAGIIAFAIVHGTEGNPPDQRGTSAASAALAEQTRVVHRVSTSPLTEAGKPLVFFMGAQFCPYCAAERWAFVKATARFGTWSNIRPLQSRAGTDGFATLPTYDLSAATFTSPQLALRYKDIADGNGNPLQALAGVERRLVDLYDPGGGFPFIAAGGPPGQFTVTLAYSPGLLQGQSFASVRAAVDEPRPASAAAQAIASEADTITALLCRLTAGNPGGVCAVPGIAALSSAIG
jgi:hypothetical protein